MKQPWLIATLALLIGSSLMTTVQAQTAADDVEEKNGKWTFGVGLLGASLPHYDGSDQSKSVVLPFPYIHYKSEKLTIDRTGIVRNLWQSDALSLTFSGLGSVKVDSKDNNARQDMPDIGWVGAAGPALNWYLRPDKSLFVQVTARKAIAFDDGIDSIGWQGETSINWRSKSTPVFGNSTMTWVLKGKLKYASSDYNQYFYGVDNQYVTTERAAYSADSGYAGAQLLAGLNFGGKRYRAGVFARYNHISNATFADSPLVKQNHNTAVGFAYAWLF